MAVRSSRARLGVSLAVSGMGALCLGFKAPAVVCFAVGVYQLERDWRARHPDFRGGASERWQAALEFYRRTHQHPTNRALHVTGIPMIVAGALGLFVAGKPNAGASAAWLGSLAAFGCGWLLNLVGHAAYERKAPAFSEDGLSFIVGPVWDLQQLLRSKQ